MKNNKNLPNQSGIYLIINTINQVPYIGQAKNIYKRVNRHHIYDYKNPNDSCYDTKFYKAIRKYGLENFEIFVLELCPEELLDEKEKFYIKLFDSFHHGYNSTEGGQNWSPKIFSKETELKRAETREKNKSLQGEKHPRAKMTDTEVIEVRQRYINGESIEQIYQDFKTRYSNKATFTNIVLGTTYKHVGNIPTESQIRHTNAKLTESQVKEIRKRYAKEKISYAKLGKEYGLSASSVMAIIKRETYKHVD